MVAVTRRVVAMMIFDLEGYVIRDMACAALALSSFALREASCCVARMLSQLRGRGPGQKELPATEMNHLEKIL